MADGMITVEYVLALPDEQLHEFQQFKVGTTLGASLNRFALDQKAKTLMTQPIYGVFNQMVQDDYLLQEGDRIEVYRPLQIDPKTARQIRVARKKRKELQAQKEAQQKG